MQQPPQAYRQQAGERLPGEEWWRELHSEDLNRLMDEAFATSPDIRTALARLEQAQAVAQKTGSALWPTLDASAEAARSWTKLHARNQVESDAYGLGLGGQL